MPNTIKLKHTTSAGDVPSGGDLEVGELALDVEEGKVYYKKASNGQVQVLVQQMYVAPDASAPANPKENALWWVDDFEVLRVYESATWKDVAVSIKSGGTFKGHIIVRDSLDVENVFETTDDGITTKNIIAEDVDLTAGDVVRDASAVGGTPNAIVATFTVPITDLTGKVVALTPASNNSTTAVTLKVDGTPVKNVVKAAGALNKDDIVAGSKALFMYNGTDFILLNPAQSRDYKVVLTPQNYVKNTTLTFAHGLGAVPSLVTMYAINKTTEYGVSVGQRIPLVNDTDSGFGANDSGVSYRYDGTNVIVTLGQDGIRLMAPDTKTIQILTDSRWEIGITCWE